MANSMAPEREIQVKVRLDLKGVSKPGRFLFGGKPVEKVAEEAREQQVTLFRNVALQGISITNIDIGMDIYTVYDELSNQEVAYAPLVLEVAVDTIEDLIRLISREDFRRIEVLSPPSLTLNRHDIERLIFRIGEEMKSYRSHIDRKYNFR
jgi:hypothetical protein